MWRGLRQRELGVTRPGRVANHISAERSRSLELSTHKEIVSAQKGGINSLQIDQTEWRYLLAGASDGSVGVYDTLQPTSFDSASHTHQHEAIFTVDKTVPQGHKFAVSSVQWYPVDTGLFVSGSFDYRINLWDTNTLQVETQFKMDGKVYAVGMSPVAATHMLIAAGTEDPRVRLCDIASGAFTHTLSGHRDSVWAVQWSVANEWVLITGGFDGAIRFWDIRQAGSYKVLDQHNSQTGRRPPVKMKQTSQQRSEQARRLSDETLGRRPEKLQKTASHNRVVKGSATLGKNAEKHLSTQRQHPGMASAEDRATAHYGTVTALTPTTDGFYLLSAGTDSRVKLWDMESGCNTLVNYESTRIRGSKGMEFSVSSDSSLLFFPSANVIQVYDLWTGRLLKSLRGHYDTVNCCAFHPDQELYSGSSDRKILNWCPPSEGPEEDDEEEVTQAGPSGTRPDEDAWSD
ncbi:unnamed protein product [Calypogeia fissa]